MIIKKLAAAVLSVVFVFTCASGCAPSSAVPNENADLPDTPSILCASFSEYDWTRRILGNNPGEITLQLLNDSGMDMHSYQPSVADMVNISDADLVIFTGGDSEFWIEDALAASESASGSRKSLKLMEIFNHNHHLADCYTSDEHEHDHDHEHDHSHGHDHPEHTHSTDEHLWLSLKMAPHFIREITEAVCELDPSEASYYTGNAEQYIAEIQALDKEYEEAASSAVNHTLLFADRYPFKYLLEDYGLKHVAAFPGCSAETEASFETILNLSDTVDSLNLGAVIILHKSDPALAQTIISNSDQNNVRTLVLNSMQSVTKADIEKGTSWLSVMESNLEVLRLALS